MEARGYAIPITEENLRGVILSEAGPTYNLNRALDWFNEYGEGWFVREEGASLDCQFFMPEVFEEMYRFVSGDRGDLIRRVIRI